MSTEQIISIIGHQKMQIKIKMRQSYSHFWFKKNKARRLQGGKKSLTILSIDKDVKHVELSHTAIENANDTATMENGWTIYSKHTLNINPVSLLLDIYSKEMRPYIHTKPCI